MDVWRSVAQKVVGVICREALLPRFPNVSGVGSAGPVNTLRLERTVRYSARSSARPPPLRVADCGVA